MGLKAGLMALSLAVGACLVSGQALAQQAAATGPAPVEAYAADARLTGASLSPDGHYIVGVQNTPTEDVLVVIDWNTKRATPIQRATRDSGLQIQFAQFKGNDRVIFGVEQRVRVVDGGSGVATASHERVEASVTYVSRVYASNVDGSNLTVLLDNEGARMYSRRISHFLVDTLPDNADDVIIGGVTNRGVSLFRVNVRNGQARTLDSGGYDVAGWTVDITGEPVLRQESLFGGRGFTWSYKDMGGAWHEFARFRGSDGANSGPTFDPVGPGPQPGTVFVAARRDGDDTSALHLFNARTGQYMDRVFGVEGFDISTAMVRREDGTTLAACYWRHSYVCEPLDNNFGRYWRGLAQAFGPQASLFLASRANDDSRWLLRVQAPDEPYSYYMFTREGARLEPVIDGHPDLTHTPLASVEVFDYTASDGQQLWGYLTVPPGAKDVRNLPMVVMPHGGPEGRDVLAFDPFAQFFASRGYLVFQPNFRGGGGFGRRFVQAGWGQWGMRMQDDVADGARAVIAAGRADPNRLCIWGWSYGGYVAATASFENADLYKCSVAGAGVTDLPRMLDWVRNEQGGATGMSYQYWTDAMGGSEGSSTLAAHSAARNADKITMPLLLIHGNLDVTVPYEQSEILQAAMARAGHPVRLVRIEDAQHQWAPMTPEQRVQVLTESVNFVSSNIGPGWTAASH